LIPPPKSFSGVWVVSIFPLHKCEALHEKLYPVFTSISPPETFIVPIGEEREDVVKHSAPAAEIIPVFPICNYSF